MGYAVGEGSALRSVGMRAAGRIAGGRSVVVPLWKGGEGAEWLPSQVGYRLDGAGSQVTSA